MSKVLDNIVSQNYDLVLRTAKYNSEFKDYIDSLAELPESADILYHYTNVDTLVNGILSKNIKNEVNLRFSSYEYMNDPNEFKTGQKLLFRIFPECDEAYVNKLLDDNKETDMYLILSLSLACDSLPMWNVYGNRGSGIALGFDRNEIGKHVGNVEQCIYSNDEFCTKIREIAEDIASKVLPDYNVKDDQERKLSQNVYHIWIPFIMSSVYMSLLKDNAFNYEQEARMIYRIKSGQEKAVQYRSHNNLIIPYIDLRYPKTILKEIWIGPTLDMARARKSLRQFLDHMGFDHVEIKESKVPYRG